MADDQESEEGPDGHEWSKISAGSDFVETMVHRADDKANLMWFGWALREAFVAGAEWQENRKQSATSAAAAEYTREEMREACRNNYNAGAAAQSLQDARPKPTIAELEAILALPDGLFEVEMQPSGEVRSVISPKYVADIAAQVAQLRVDVAKMGNALADYFDNGSDYSTGAKVRAIAERQGTKNG